MHIYSSIGVLLIYIWPYVAAKQAFNPTVIHFHHSSNKNKKVSAARSTHTAGTYFLIHLISYITNLYFQNISPSPHYTEMGSTMGLRNHVAMATEMKTSNIDEMHMSRFERMIV